MTLFDTHAHYDDAAFDADREALLASLPENGGEGRSQSSSAVCMWEKMGRHSS